MLLLLFIAYVAQGKFDYTIMYKSPSLYTRIQNGRREKILMDNNCGKESRCKFLTDYCSLSVQHARFWPTTILTLYASSMQIGSGNPKVNKTLKSLGDKNS